MKQWEEKEKTKGRWGEEEKKVTKYYKYKFN